MNTGKIKKENTNTFSGFTLLEIVVSLGIFTLIAGLILANFRQGQKMDDLKRGTLELVSNLRKVQNLGMSGQVANLCTKGDGDLRYHSCQSDIDCGDEGSCTKAVPSGGYGISINPVEIDYYGTDCDFSLSQCPVSYTLFVDSTGIPGAYEPDPYEPEYNQGDFPLAGGLNYALPQDVYIADYKMDCVWSGGEAQYPCVRVQPSGIEITFRPPKPTPFCWTWRPSENPLPFAIPEQSIRIILRHAVTGKCREITINGVSGEVSEAASDCTLPGN